MSPIAGITFAVLLLAVNAFFVAGEFAITSSRKAQIDPLVEQGKRGAKDAQWALEHVSLMLAVTQLGITLASTGLGAVAEPAVAHLVEQPLEYFNVPPATSHIIGFVAALIIVVFLHILTGEMIPMNLTVSAPVPVVLALAPLLVRLGRLVSPIVHAMDSTANWFVRLSGREPQTEVSSTFTAEEVASIVELSEREGTLRDDIGLLTESLEFSEETVGSVMVPFEEVVCLQMGVTPAQIEHAVSKTGFSRFPLLEGSEICGYLHLKDVLDADEVTRHEPVARQRVRNMPEVSPESEVERALEKMQHTGVHVARVTKDDSVIGFIFLEDIVEELVGEVRDAMQKTLY
ncbi:MAG: hemolysin family protein [Actinomycetaceae bacterium]|nr:hemolysin family protein [Actinomycetaceae bacterium]